MIQDLLLYGIDMTLFPGVHHILKFSLISLSREWSPLFCCSKIFAEISQQFFFFLFLTFDIEGRPFCLRLQFAAQSRWFSGAPISSSHSCVCGTPTPGPRCGGGVLGVQAAPPELPTICPGLSPPGSGYIQSSSEMPPDFRVAQFATVSPASLWE